MKHADRLNLQNQQAHAKHQLETKQENERHARLADRTILVLAVAVLAAYLWLEVLKFLLQAS